MSKVLVIGGGAAGMFAAIFAAYNGNEVHIFEKSLYPVDFRIAS